MPSDPTPQAGPATPATPADPAEPAAQPGPAAPGAPTPVDPVAQLGPDEGAGTGGPVAPGGAVTQDGAVTKGGAAAQGDAAAPAAAPGQQPGAHARGPEALPQHKIHRTRASGTWTAICLFTLVLLLLLIFILENGHTVDVSYFGAHGHLPLGVALLLAAVCGILLVVFAGSARIIQLRATARKHRRADANAGQAAQARR
jgi:lipopolysaccharide assembly protein A